MQNIKKKKNKFLHKIVVKVGDLALISVGSENTGLKPSLAMAEFCCFKFVAFILLAITLVSFLVHLVEIRCGISLNSGRYALRKCQFLVISH